MRLLHTMIRVADLQASLQFYTEILGMELLRQKDYTDGRFTLAFVGYGSEEQGAVIELTHNWDTKNYTLGEGFGHIAIGVPNIYRLCEEIKAKGHILSREPGPMKFGGSEIAFVKDPDGYSIELIQQ